jgi:hypothetical protein
MHADDLAALIEKIDIASVHMLGNSTGASVALIPAKRRPDLVRTLPLCYEQSKITSVDVELDLNGTSSKGGDYLFVAFY